VLTGAERQDPPEKQRLRLLRLEFEHGGEARGGSVETAGLLVRDGFEQGSDEIGHNAQFTRRK
jgi:hypothetical protein